ncbi:MAG: BTAD domain-containing putative transcriptional regulator [Candidatus Sericytochromatia bacterium]|nr:BTAD domain-containing putative transcriptional regulator [Candidatus Sericytochromatia bacterium]
MTVATWLLEAALRPPQAPAPQVHPAWLMPFEAWPLVQVLDAGPGAGKTVGLRLLLDAVPAGWARVWLSLDGTALDARTIYRLLVHGVRDQVPGFGAGLSDRLGGEAAEPRAAWLALLDEIAACGLPGVVVALDDVHRLDEGGREGLRVLLALLALRPPGLRLLLGTRTQLSLGLARLEGQGVARVFGPAQLHWSAGEAEAFFAAVGLPAERLAAARALAARLEGWPLGVVLACRGHEAPQALLGGGDGLAAVTAYLAEDVFAACSGPMQALLLRLSLLPVVTPAAAHVLCPDLDVDVLMAQAEREHLLQRLDGGSRHRLPAYMREFLPGELARRVPPDQLRRWHAQLADAHTAWGRHEDALAHALAAGAWSQALQAGQRCFPAMRYDGRSDVIARFLDGFPAQAVEHEPLWWLWRGLNSAHAGDYEAAGVTYARALALAQRQGDAALQFRLAVVQASQALVVGDEERLQAYLATAGALQAEGLEEDRVDLLLVQASLAEREGDLVRMQQANEAVLGVPCGANVELIASHAIAMRNLFSLAYHRGDRARAKGHVADLMSHAGRNGLAAAQRFGEFMRALLHLEEGEAAVAEQFFRTLPERWPDGLDWFDRSLARVALAEWHAAQGRRAEAEGELRLALLTLEAARFDDGRVLILERLLWLHLRHDAPDAAEAVMEAHEGPWRLDPASWGKLPMHEAALALAVARLWQVRGEPAAALQASHTLGDRLAALAANGYAARARLVQASALVALGRRDEARAAHDQAARLAPGSLAAVCPARAIWLELEDLRHDQVEPPASAAPPLSAPLTGPRAEEAGVGLEIRALGTFEVRVDGVRIEVWPRRRAQQVLLALALYPRGLSRPALAELLGEDGQDTSGLRAAWSTLRKVLEPRLGARAASGYLVVEDERHALAPARIRYCDLHAFEAALAEGRRLERSDPIAAAERYAAAVRHYRGPLHGLARFDAEREALAERASAAWLWLSGHHQRHGAMLAAEAVLVDATAVAPDDEAVCLALMALHHAQGRPERVRVAYWDHRRALATLRGVRPSEEVDARYQAWCG